MDQDKLIEIEEDQHNLDTPNQPSERKSNKGLSKTVKFEEEKR